MIENWAIWYWHEPFRLPDFSGLSRRQLGILRCDIVILAKEVQRIVFSFQFCQFLVLLWAISRLNPAPAFISTQMIGVDSRRNKRLCRCPNVAGPSDVFCIMN